MKKNILLPALLFCLNAAFAQNLTRVVGSPYPIAAAVPDKLYLTSENFSYSQKIALQSLQGLLARTKPEILRDTHGHATVLEGVVPIDRTYYNNFNGLLTRYANRFDGYILCTKQTASVNVAFSLGAILNAIAIPADIESAAIAAGYTMVLDARNKDEAWALANYGERLSKTIASYQAYNDDRALFVGDYSTFTGALQFWDNSATGSLATSVYNRMNPLAVYFGWGAGEYETVNQLSRKSAMIHPSDWSPNLSTISNIPVKLPRQKTQPTEYKTIPNVHTICFVITDGDNIQWLSGTSDNTGNWANPAKSRLNLGWTISPAFAELAPVMYKKYIENALTSDYCKNTLLAGPSGVGYYFPSIYPQLAAQNAYANKVMKKADLSIVNIIDVDGQHNPNAYLEQSNVDALFYYSYGSQYQGVNGAIKWYKDKPSIGGRFAFWGNSDDSSAATKLRVTQTLANRLNNLQNGITTNINSASGYTLIPVHIWTMNPTDVLNLVNMLNPNIRVVSPEEFVWLIRKNVRQLNLGAGNGIQAEYTAPNFTLPVKLNEPRIDFDDEFSTEGTQLVGNNNFTLRYSGKIQAIYSQKYTFYSTAKGGAKLKIGTRILCDSLSYTNVNSADTITLRAGEQYDIEFIYNKTGTKGFATLEWESSSQCRQIVPHYQLFSRPQATTDIVTAFEESNFSGYSAGLKLGSYDSLALVKRGVENRKIQSLKITSGLKVRVFSQNNFTGDSIDISADNANLAAWNNRTASLKVLNNSANFPEGIYTITAAIVDYNIEMKGNYLATENGTKAQLARVTGNTNQQFRLKKLTDGSYSISCVAGGRNWEIADFSKENNAFIQLWTANNADNQRFIFIETEEAGIYKIFSCFSGKIVEASTTVSSAQIRQSIDSNQSRGKWKITPVPPLANGSGLGLTGEYYNGVNFNTLKDTRVDSVINFAWGTASPIRNVINVDNFSIRWQGTIEPRTTGTYVFYVNSDNGRRLWVNDQLIIDKWLDDYDIEYSGSISLTEGMRYSIKLDYYEKDGGAYCRLEWAAPKQPREFVPKSQLYPLGYAGNEELTKNNAQLTISIYNGQLTINNLNNNLTINYVQIFDITGKKIVHYPLSIVHSIDVSHLPTGIYLIKINTNEGIIMQKFIKN